MQPPSRVRAPTADRHADDPARHAQAFERAGVAAIDVEEHDGVDDPAQRAGAADIVIDYGFCLRAASQAMRCSTSSAPSTSPKKVANASSETSCSRVVHVALASATMIVR